MTVRALSLILPCYNEIPHLRENLAHIVSYLERNFDRRLFEIILIDDASTDQTKAELLNFQNENKNLSCKVIFHQANLGRGAAVKTGIAAASHDIVGFIDIDREISENFIGLFVDAIIDGSDLAIARRTFSRGISLYGFVRKTLSLGYRKISKWYLRHEYSDTEAGFKFFRRDAAISLLRTSKFDHWFWDTEVCLLAKARHCKIKEIPVLYSRRKDKKSSVKLLKDIIRQLRAMLELRRHYPLPDHDR